MHFAAPVKFLQITLAITAIFLTLAMEFSPIPILVFLLPSSTSFIRRLKNDHKYTYRCRPHGLWNSADER